MEGFSLQWWDLKSNCGVRKVARDTVLKFNPDVHIVAHHANVKDSRFGLEYFQQFDLVMNALDNLGTLTVSEIRLGLVVKE